MAKQVITLRYNNFGGILSSPPQIIKWHFQDFMHTHFIKGSELSKLLNEKKNCYQQ